jgi:alpha-glucosidase (family GH31 glycosyl hydrolase)
MNDKWSRRRILKQFAVASAALTLPMKKVFADARPSSADQDLELQIASVSANTIRLSILPVKNEKTAEITYCGALVREAWGAPVAKLNKDRREQVLQSGTLRIHASVDPLSIAISNATGASIQTLNVDRTSGVVSFETGESPLLGLGEGGPQFDRRTSTDKMVSGQGGYKLETHGGRVPIPWIIGTAGWAIFFHQPFGTFDFTGPQSKFTPTSLQTAFPLDIFFVASSDPATIMSEYSALTGRPELPPLWSLGYQQSHRTLASRDEVLAEAKTFRDKRLPCDSLIYLGTGFCPSGWNTENGSFSWNPRVFPDPQRIIDELHKDNFRVVLHDVILTDKLRGTVRDTCKLSAFDEDEASCYWDAHRKNFAMGIDGWWPDEGDPLDIPSRLARNRMHWEGPQLDRPNERPYALHRNGYAGMQRYASFLWSGDVYSTWETLKTQVSIAINTSLTGIPYWGTDIGGFVPTKEFSAELYLRWFQFGAFCTLFRSHGRAWKLRLPWGWNTGDPGPTEIRNYDGAAIPDSTQLHNDKVEPICRKFLELRYRMLPYTYSAVREATVTGMPVMRAMWLHYPDDPKAVACRDQYLWGRDILVAPVFEKGATSRNVYLPRGTWFDFWTQERVEGGREVSRPVDLDTMPIFVRAGAIIPLGPIKQHTAEKVDQPLSLFIYPGTDASFHLYEDDGSSFNYRSGEWMGVDLHWDDARRVLDLKLSPGSRMLSPANRSLEVKLGSIMRTLIFTGAPHSVPF